MRDLRTLGLLAAVLLALPAPARAQSGQVLGTRAQGMGGAFVGVADDASAVFWNPAGLAGGAFFSLVLDGHTAESIPEAEPGAASRSGWLLALTTPALGLSYYRLQTTSVRPADSGSESESVLDTLVTHHLGATLVQSLSDAVAVGATVKVVRGFAASAEVPAGDREELLDAWDLMGRNSTRADMDVGIMARSAFGHAGLTVRNLVAPSFETGGSAELGLERQVRGGASVLLLPNWRLAADLDLNRHDGPMGQVREFAVGAEGQVTPRLAARTGLRLNTAGDRGRSPSISFGGSFAVVGSVQVDAQVTAGRESAFTGWGLAGRLVF